MLATTKGKLYLMITLSCISHYIMPSLQFDSIPLASQFLGTHNIGNEQVLLFKLPQSISTQMMQEQLKLQQKQHQDKQQQEQQYHRNIFIPSNVISSNQQYQPETESQTISLTIPLSSLGTTGFSNSHAEHMGYGQLPSSGSRSSSSRFMDAVRRPEQIMSLPLIDYLASESSQVSQESLHGSDSNGGQQQQQQQQLVSQQLQPNIQTLSNLTSNMEQQVRAFMVNQQAADQLSNATLALTTPYPSLPRQEPQPQLWRDTQAYRGQETQKSHQQESPPVTSADGSSLMAKLANSSPELLLRLKSLLNKVVQQKYLLENHNNGSSGEPIKVLTLKSELANLNQAAGNDYNYLNAATNNPNSALNKFLAANQNLTSAEEVKIPIVVIAMPRVLSLKRNSSSQMKFDGDSTQSTALPFTQQATIPFPLQANNITHQGNNSIVSNGAQLVQLTSAVGQPSPILSHNYSDQLNLTNTPAPYLYLNDDNNLAAYQQASIDDISNHSSQQPHPSIMATGNAGTQHTMAPYARQFISPVSSTFALSPQQQQLKQIAYLTDETQASYNPYSSSPLKFKQLETPWPGAIQNGGTNFVVESSGSNPINSLAGQYVYRQQLAQQLQPDPRILYGRSQNQDMIAGELLKYIQNIHRQQQQLRAKRDDANLRVQFAASASQRELQPTVIKHQTLHQQGKSPLEYEIQLQNEPQVQQYPAQVSQVQVQHISSQPMAIKDGRQSELFGASSGDQQMQQQQYQTATGIPLTMPLAGQWGESRMRSLLQSLEPRGQQQPQQMLVSQPNVVSSLERLRPLFQVKRRSDGQSKDLAQFPGHKLASMTTKEILSLMERGSRSGRPSVSSIQHQAMAAPGGLTNATGSRRRSAPKMLVMIV